VGIPDNNAPMFSNAVRLTGREWLAVGAFAVLLLFLPLLWKEHEQLDLTTDYRIPHDLSADYWLYQRVADESTDRFDTILLGDSVIWGEYVTPEGTLSHYLNERLGRQRCANLGLDGAHPLALAGLIQYYAGSVRGKIVLLHCNPLWLTSLRADLQDEKVTKFNHPRLVPQFFPRIPSYQEEVSPRIGAVMERYVPLNQWTSHLQQAYYGQSADGKHCEPIDIPGWTLLHPYENPAGPLAKDLPTPEKSLRHDPIPWFKRGKRSELEQDFPWIDLDTSLQWQAFRRAVEILRQRGNRVFVLVGPFNEHLLSAGSRRRYQEVKATITAWLQTQDVPHAAPPPLPSEHYGDASHPLAAGYALLAQQLLKERFFQRGP
jgi:hypothetical protein